MADRKVMVVNVSNATVGISIPNENFKRLLRGEGAKTYVPFDILYEGLSETGVLALFEEGYLIVKDKQDRIDLGLETVDTVEEVKDNSMDSKEMLEILKSGDPIKVKDTLTKLSPVQQRKMAEVAIKNEIYSAGLAKIIEDFTGINLLENIQEYKAEQEDRI